MYACICNAVTVAEVHDAIDHGAETIEQLGLLTRAGTCCGGCHDTLDEILESRCGSCPLAALAVA